MATIHANSARDAFGRLEMLLGFGGMAGEVRTLRRYIASSIQVIVHLSRMANGQRRVMSVAEVTGTEGDSQSLNELFRFEEHPPLSGRGAFQTLSRRPFFSHRLKGPARTARQEQRRVGTEGGRVMIPVGAVTLKKK